MGSGFESGFFHQGAERCAGGEGLYGFIEIAVSGKFSREGSAQVGEDVPQVEEAEGADRERRKRKFKNQRSAAGFENPVDFFQRAKRAGNVPDAEGEGGGVERVVFEGELFRICALE